MSTRSTIFLTNDNEHWYRDCSYEHDNKGNIITDYIELEFDGKNAEIIEQGKDFFSVRVYPDTDLHSKICQANENRNVYIVEADYVSHKKIICLINCEEEAEPVLNKYGIGLVDIIDKDWNFTKHTVQRKTASINRNIAVLKLPETITIIFMPISTP